MDLSLVLRDPFSFVDNLNLTWRGHNFNVFLLHRKWIWLVAMGTMIPWVLMGFDSGVGQLDFFLVYTDDFLRGEISLQEWIGWYHYGYGKTCHWSALTFYGLLMWSISRHLLRELLIFSKSKTFIFSLGLAVLNMGLFEAFWQHSFAVLQNQPWTVTWIMPQFNILLQRTTWIIAGLVVLLYFYLDSFILDEKEEHVVGRLYQFHPDKKMFLVIGATLGLTVIWIFYPLPVEQISVETTAGVWTNTNLFPQTLYTIDEDPLDNQAAGVWHYVPNDLIHLLNTVHKAMLCFTQWYLISRFKIGEDG